MNFSRSSYDGSMNKHFVPKLRGLEADIAGIETQIHRHWANKTNAQLELIRLKFTGTRSVTRAKIGGHHCLSVLADGHRR